MRATLNDIARAAGVSLATVDRGLNNRPGVSARTRAQIEAVAQALGYLAPQNTPAPVRLRVLLPAGTNSFIRDLAVQVRQQSALLPGVEAVVETLEGLDPGALAMRLSRLGRGVDGVAVVALDHPSVREALRGLAQAGVQVVTLVSDIRNVPRLAYIGIDNAQAGRLAGYVVGRFLGRGPSARVALFAGSLAYRGHQEREMGFRQVLAEAFPAFGMEELREIHEDRDRAYAETCALLDRCPDLAAIYNAGGATTGIARALKDRGRAGKVVFVAHEVTAGNKALLLDGTLDAVIDQNPRVEVREALAALVHAVRGQHYRVVPPRLQIVFRENLPDD